MANLYWYGGNGESGLPSGAWASPGTQAQGLGPGPIKPGPDGEPGPNEAPKGPWAQGLGPQAWGGWGGGGLEEQSLIWEFGNKLFFLK